MTFVIIAGMMDSDVGVWRGRRGGARRLWCAREERGVFGLGSCWVWEELLVVSRRGGDRVCSSRGSLSES